MEVDAGGMVENGSGSEDGLQQQQHQQLTGPRPAPAYKAITAICEKRDDGPGLGCGHTLTTVAVVGEEGTSGYVGPRLILFGGATALEGNSGQAGPQAAAAGTGIRTFLFLMNLFSGVWKKIPWLLFLFFLEKRELIFSMSIRYCL